MGIRVAVAGASGYAGGELLRLVAGHPEFDLVAATAHSQAGHRVDVVHPQLTGLDLVLGQTDPATLADADLVFLALPHGESAALASQLPAEVRVVDLGADHRLADPYAWAQYYGGTHAGQWTYGLPELPGQRELIAGSTRVANTGCYAAAITLALAPLIADGAASPADVVVVAASGTSGAGRAAKPHLLASEVQGTCRRTGSAPTSTCPKSSRRPGRPGCRSPRFSRRCRAASWPRSPQCRRAASTRSRCWRRRTRTRRSCTCWRRAVATHRCHAGLQLVPPAGHRRRRLGSADRAQRAGQPRQGRGRSGRAERQPDARPAGDDGPVDLGVSP